MGRTTNAQRERRSKAIEEYKADLKKAKEDPNTVGSMFGFQKANMKLLASILGNVDFDLDTFRDSGRMDING